jgi:5-methylcytosine-specific restriction endonuclease McrA
MPFATKAVRDRARKRVAIRVRAGEPCCFCGEPIDLSIPWPDPWSFVVDHATPTSHGGEDHGDHQLRPAHKQCNERRSNQPSGTVGRNSGVLG